MILIGIQLSQLQNYKKIPTYAHPAIRPPSAAILHIFRGLVGHDARIASSSTRKPLAHRPKGDKSARKEPPLRPRNFKERALSRRYSSAELQRLKRQWDETIRSQGVLISPFIHPVEKEYMQRGIEDGASIIRLVAANPDITMRLIGIKP